MAIDRPFTGVSVHHWRSRTPAGGPHVAPGCPFAGSRLRRERWGQAWAVTYPTGWLHCECRAESGQQCVEDEPSCYLKSSQELGLSSAIRQAVRLSGVRLGRGCTRASTTPLAGASDLGELADYLFRKNRAKSVNRPKLNRNPAGGRGGSASVGALHLGQGSPAAPQPHAFGPSQGRSGWASHTQPVSSQAAQLMCQPSEHQPSTWDAPARQPRPR
ncbi:hypothetical protein ACVWZ6_006479 [Bradyrhizobium sp. GM6.1]